MQAQTAQMIAGVLGSLGQIARDLAGGGKQFSCFALDDVKIVFFCYG